MGDFFGLLFMVGVLVALYLFMRPKIAVGCREIKPDMTLNGLAVKRMEQGQSLEQAFQIKQTTFGR